jgi:hypothetical protein
MTRGRTIWLALLAVGTLVAILLRTPDRKRDPSDLELRSAATQRRSSDEAREFEVEVVDPIEAGLAPASASSGAEPANEAELVVTLAKLWQDEPERALALAEDGEKHFGESPRAVERRLYEIKALVKLGRIGKARTRAERYLAAYPPGPMTDEVERLTGVHRRPEPEPTP